MCNVANPDAWTRVVERSNPAMPRDHARAVGQGIAGGFAGAAPARSRAQAPSGVLLGARGDDGALARPVLKELLG